MKQLIPLLAAAAVWVPAASASAQPADQGVRIFCEDEARPGAYFVSRAAVIETGRRLGHEVLVASGHTFRSREGGLRDCTARTEFNSRGIRHVRLSEDGGDWAVAVTTSRFSDPVRRWRILNDAGRLIAMVEQGGELTLYPGDPDERRCHARAPVSAEQVRQGAPDGAFTHDCPQGPGASGSPLSAVIDGERRLVAIYVGRLREAGVDGELGVALPMEGPFAVAVRDALGGG